MATANCAIKITSPSGETAFLESLDRQSCNVDVSNYGPFPVSPTNDDCWSISRRLGEMFAGDIRAAIGARGGKVELVDMPDL